MHYSKFAVVSALAAVATVLLVAIPGTAGRLGHDQVATAHVVQADNGLAAVRAATAPEHDVTVARANGYGLFTDAAGIACIDNPPVGAMGIHYVNGNLVASGQIDPLRPQALVYEPEKHGHLHLVAVEYIADQKTWDATHSMAPMLFGQMFMLTTAPNRFGIPAFYSLHAWIWKHNPSGMFSMWNPQVSCNAEA
ncbi:MAG TPA: hypothetical protein VJQ45_12005 [Ktedonobacterales bacterium]|nr:hypothetical protein [Ktedonobacterales bacterium]